MFLHVLEAKYLHNYVIWLRFNDGSEGEIDLQGELDGEVFESLKDLEKFKKKYVKILEDEKDWKHNDAINAIRNLKAGKSAEVLDKFALHGFSGKPEQLFNLLMLFNI